MITSVLTLAQMDYGPMMSGVCTLTGFVIVPSAFFAWFFLIRRKRRSAGVITCTVLSSLALLVWLAGLVDLHFEPSIDDVDAVMMVEDIPEVKQYLNSSPRAWPASQGEQVWASDGGTWHEWEVSVGDNKRDEHAKPWNVFSVHCVTGQIKVLVDSDKNKWIPLTAWQARTIK